jgi:hypothetical protein
MIKFFVDSPLENHGADLSFYCEKSDLEQLIRTRKADFAVYTYGNEASVGVPDPGSGVLLTPGSGIWDG